MWTMKAMKVMKITKRPSFLEQPKGDYSIAFAADSALGLGLSTRLKPPREAGWIVLTSVDATSAAAAVPLGARLVCLNESDVRYKSRLEVIAAIQEVKATGGSFTITFQACKALP